MVELELLPKLTNQNTNVRCYQVLKKAELAKAEVEGKNYYYIDSQTRTFDKIFRRLPTEIYPDREAYRIYLGSSSIETVVSLYGLTNLTIYGSQELRKYLYEVNEAPRVENIEPLLKYLHSAAVLKVLTYAYKGDLKTLDQMQFCQCCLAIENRDIVAFYCDLVR
ncbi:MAG: hypothetical protein IK079_00150 [Desulfovibrio sp.]|nr:hypothetical protein [Desulfovibrio sp.]